MTYTLQPSSVPNRTRRTLLTKFSKTRPLATVAEGSLWGGFYVIAPGQGTSLLGVRASELDGPVMKPLDFLVWSFSEDA